VTSRARLIAFRVLTVCILVLVSFVLTEIGYRIYMHYDLKRTMSSAQPDSDEIIGFNSFPHAMVYNATYGHDFYSGGFVTGAIKGNRFDFCERRDIFAADGNMRPRVISEGSTARTVLLFGSSFTLTTDESGATASDIAAAMLTERLGRSVHIVNFSRGSFGILQMLDMARAKVRAYQPDLILFVFNTSDISRPRSWPIFKEMGDGYYHFYMSRSPDPRDIRVQTARLSSQVVSALFTPIWCKTMMAAKVAHDKIRLVDDPTVKATVEHFKVLSHLVTAPHHNIDLKEMTTSYVWLQLRYGNPYHDTEAFAAGENPIGPITVNDFRRDPGFLSGLAFLTSSGIPSSFVHLPSYAEMKSGEEFKFGIHGVPAEREEKLVASLREATGHPIASLLSYMRPPIADAETLVNGALPPHMDWHPSASGTQRIGSALASLITDQLRQP